MLRKYIVEANAKELENLSKEKISDYFVTNDKLFCVYLAEDESDVIENSSDLPYESIKEVALTLADKPYIPKD